MRCFCHLLCNAPKLPGQASGVVKRQLPNNPRKSSPVSRTCSLWMYAWTQQNSIALLQSCLCVYVDAVQQLPVYNQQLLLYAKLPNCVAQTTEVPNASSQHVCWSMLLMSMGALSLYWSSDAPVQICTKGMQDSSWHLIPFGCSLRYVLHVEVFSTSVSYGQTMTRG